MERSDAWRIPAVGLAFVLGAAALLRPQWFAGPLLQTWLEGAAEQRLDESLARNSVSFLALSGTKAVLASVEGSSVGVGFHFELGDLVQPAYDYVDFVWHAFLYALALLGLYKLLVQTGILELGISLLGVSLLLLAAGALLRERWPAPRIWAWRVAALGLAVAYAVPLALLASQLLTQRYLEPLRERSAERIAEAGAPLGDAADRLRGLRERLSILEPGRSLDELQDEARRIATDASDAIWERTQAFMSYALILAVELLLLPFLSAWLVLKAMGAAPRTVRGLRRG